jgi:HEAT repeat protein
MRAIPRLLRARAVTALGAAFVLPCIVLSARPASGEPKGKTGGIELAPPLVVPLPADTVKRLKSNDPAQIKSALDDVRVSGKAAGAAVPAISDLLKQGLPPALTEAALETLGETASDGASEVLSWYAHHREVKVRRMAVEALGKTHGPVAIKGLRAALSDPDEKVRGTSATALGEMKAKEAVPDLFVALDHKVEEAAASIGQLCEPADCEKLAGKLGNVPFDVMSGGLDQILLRGTKEVDDETKIRIVGRVRELGTGQANQFLKDVQAKWPAKTSPKVKQSIDQAVMATSASPGAANPEGSP